MRRPRKVRAPLPAMWRTPDQLWGVVERALAWPSKCRGLLIRYEKEAEHDLGLLKLACCLIWFRRYFRLNGLEGHDDRRETYVSDPLIQLLARRSSALAAPLRRLSAMDAEAGSGQLSAAGQSLARWHRLELLLGAGLEHH